MFHSPIIFVTNEDVRVKFSNKAFLSKLRVITASFYMKDQFWRVQIKVKLGEILAEVTYILVSTTSIVSGGGLGPYNINLHYLLPVHSQEIYEHAH